MLLRVDFDADGAHRQEAGGRLAEVEDGFFGVEGAAGRPSADRRHSEFNYVKVI